MDESPSMRQSPPSLLDLWKVLCLIKLTLDVVFLDISGQLRGSPRAPSRFRRAMNPWQAGSHSSTTAELTKCQAWIGIQDSTSSDVFLCPQEAPFLGGELVYGRNLQRVSWWASGDFVWCNLIESKLTVNSFTESCHSGIISGYVQGATWGHPPCCSTVPSSIYTSHSRTSARTLLRWHLLREAFFDPATLVAASFRCYYISLTLLFFRLLYHYW